MSPQYWCRICGEPLLLETGEVDDISYYWWECPHHPNAAQDETARAVKVEGV